MSFKGTLPQGVPNIVKEWNTATHHHWIENIRDESYPDRADKVIQIHRKIPLFKTKVGLN